MIKKQFCSRDDDWMQCQFSMLNHLRYILFCRFIYAHAENWWGSKCLSKLYITHFGWAKRHTSTKLESYGPGSYCYNFYWGKDKQKVANTIIKQGLLRDRYARMGYETIYRTLPCVDFCQHQGRYHPKDWQTRSGRGVDAQFGSFRCKTITYAWAPSRTIVTPWFWSTWELN